MRKVDLYLILPLLVFLTYSPISGQIPNGSIAPNFIATDINGEEHNLYQVLAEGKQVILDFSTTWCGPCWSYHNTGALETIYEELGPDGTDELMVYYIESDIETTMDDLLGLTNGSQGDWVTGTDYPIIDDSSIKSPYQVGSYPTIIKVCGDRKVKSLGQPSVDVLRSEIEECPTIEVPSEPFFYATNYNGCESLDVQFTDNSWPPPSSYLWDFGDGNTSNEASPYHSYTEPGNYDVSLEVANNFGGESLTKESLIQIGEGNPNESQFVGPENIDIGTGRYFEGGHQALIFDVHEPVVLNTVKVFSNMAFNRTIVLLDGSGELLNIKTVFIPEGEQTIDINFYIPQGTDYRLGLYTDAFLFRNDGGASYPYELDNLVSITKSTADTAPTQYYYFFYDWDVREAGCTNMVSAEIFNKPSFNVYPNPASEKLCIDGEIPSLSQVVIYNNLGQIMKPNIKQTPKGLEINTTHFIPGMYFITVGEQTIKFQRH